MIDNTPIYNLKAVIKETGLSPATLRAWERRYGLIKPSRSPGGHRLYSRQDIEQLKWLVARQDEGLSISQAVEMWKMHLEGVDSGPMSIEASAVISGTGEAMLDELRDQWITACLAFDDQAANQVLDQAFAIAPPEAICMEVLEKGLVQVGQGWYNGSVSVQQEHFASAIAIRRLNVLLVASPAPTRRETILAACPPGEEHDFILLMVTYLLRRSGWSVLYLGSNVPFENLDATIKSIQPSLVLSAVQTLASAASLSEMSQYLVSQRIPLAYGGGIFRLVPAATSHVFGYYLGKNLAMVSRIIELLVTAPPEVPHTQPISSEYSQALANFSQYESTILARASTAMQGGSIKPDHMEFAFVYLTRMIAAALTLGDVHLLDDAVPWLDGLLKNYGHSPATVRLFYKSYHQAVESQLGTEGNLILEWLVKNQ